MNNYGRYEINPDVAKPSINVDREYSKILAECITEINDGIAQIRQILQNLNIDSRPYRRQILELAENANILDKLFKHLCQRNPNLVPAG